MENLISYIVIIVMAAILGSLSYWYGARITKKNKVAAKWPTVPGVIISAELDSYVKYDDIGNATTMYTPLINYEYEVEGQVYSNNRVKVQAFVATNTQSVSRKKLEEYPVGSAVEVHYDPFSPEDAILEIDPSKINIPMIIGIISGLIVLYTGFRMIRAL
jgi:hypothetical protein